MKDLSLTLLLEKKLKVARFIEKFQLIHTASEEARGYKLYINIYFSMKFLVHFVFLLAAESGLCSKQISVQLQINSGAFC